MSASDSMDAGKDGAKTIEAHLTTKHLISLIGLVVAVAAILVGSVKYKWSYDQIAATFFTLAVVVGLLNGMGINGTTKVFIGGCSKMVNAAFIVGFANGISVILASGNILNTIVYWLSIPMSGMGSILGANFMFVANLFINLFIPSGSGQAAAVMPLMVPVADLAGITRQVAVRISLKTGRHHQIRVQMAHHGTPLYGDMKYGVPVRTAKLDKKENADQGTMKAAENRNMPGIRTAGNMGSGRESIALCASSLTFFHPVTKKKMTFEIEPVGGAFQLFQV